MPYNLEAEQSVLGSIILDSTCLSNASAKLNEKSFFLPEHQQIFASMLALDAIEGTGIDVITLADNLEKSDYSGQMSVREYILRLAQGVPSTANIDQYVNIVRDQYYLRELITLSQDVIDNASAPGADAKLILEATEQKLYDMRSGSRKSGAERLSSIISNKVYEKLRQLTGENREQYLGFPTGFGLLDKYLTGLNRSDLILIGARPAMGKTSFALNLAHNLTLSAKKKVVFFSLEMTNEQLAERLLASQSGVESQKFRTGDMSTDEWERIGLAAQMLMDIELYFVDSSSITVPEMKSLVRQERDVDCVIIDYLGLIQSSERTENRVQEVTKITKQLKIMAKDLNIPVVCCAQLSRGTEGRGKSHRPQLSDLRESGSIEQDADIVLFLYREDYYENELDDAEREEIDNNKTELIIAKNRHGETGTVPLVFDSQFTRFRAVEFDGENGYGGSYGD